jgi:hypothetical protein
MDAAASGARIACQTNDVATYGEVVWSWRSNAGAKFAMMLRITQMTVATKQWSQEPEGNR